MSSCALLPRLRLRGLFGCGLGARSPVDGNRLFAIASQPNFSTARARPRIPMAFAVVGSAATRFTASAKACSNARGSASSYGTRMPVSPSTTTSEFRPQRSPRPVPRSPSPRGSRSRSGSYTDGRRTTAHDSELHDVVAGKLCVNPVDVLACAFQLGNFFGNFRPSSGVSGMPRREPTGCLRRTSSPPAASARYPSAE